MQLPCRAVSPLTAAICDTLYKQGATHMEWTDISITVAKRDADTAEAIATMVANGGIYIEDYSDLE